MLLFLTVVKQKGADIARLWVSSTDYLADVRISDEILKQTLMFIVKLEIL